MVELIYGTQTVNNQTGEHTMKKILTSILTAALIAASLLTQVSAAPKAAEFKASKLTKVPTFDGVISDGEYGIGDAIKLTDSRLEPTAWVSGHSIDPDLDVQYKFAWDDSNLYMAVTVKGDKSPSQSADENAAWFGKADCIQVFVNPEYKVAGASPVCFTIGFSEGKTPVVWRSKLGMGVIVTGECKGFSSKYDNGYTMEIAIPWKTILIDTDKITTSDTKISEGTKLGLSLVYADVGGTASYVKTDGNKWNGDELGSAMLTLSAAVKTTTEKPASAAQTPDMIGLTILTLAASAGAAYIAKKRG